MSAEVQKETVQPSGASAQNITSLGDNGVPTKKARETAAAALVGALVALFFFVIAVVLCVRRRRRGSAAAATERAHRFVDAPPDLQRLVRRGETDDAHAMGGTPFHRVTHPLRKYALRNAAPLRAGENHKRNPARAMFARAEQASGDGGTNAGVREAQQLQLAEENLVLRMRIREMESLSNVHSSAGRAGAPDSDAPPDYDDAGIAL